MDDPRLYMQTAKLLRTQIEDGTLKPDGQALSISALCRRTGQSRQTVAKGLQLLEREGWLTRIPGRGYYVVRR